MSMEADLAVALKALCTRVYPDTAPAATPTPYITWQALGGESIYTLSNAPIDKRRTLMQVNVWAASRLQATTLSRDIEAALAGTAAFVATPTGEPMSVYETDTKLYGSIQRFDIWSSR
ncbi:MAG: DUF3168 domain-containing protein [Burkholderiales bacterium]|nr:DUF3168 domain-containing protein [Burkholderiales bacterium]